MAKWEWARLRNGRMQVVLAMVCAAGVFGGAQLTRANRIANDAMLTQERLDGAWELQSVGGEAVGPNAHSGVLSQRVTFARGLAQGETRLWATSAAATTAMPFPDQSVADVKESADGHDVTVTWNGTYAILPNSRIELHIGRAQYKLAGKFLPQTHTLELEQDAILTYRGAARYQPTAVIAHK